MDKEFLQAFTVGEQTLPEETVEAILACHQQEMDRLRQENRASLDQMRLDSAVEKAVIQAGGRNQKAIAALLDLQQIAGAQNPEKALEQAMQALKKENGYLFQEPTPPPYAKSTGFLAGAAPVTLAGALRERMRR